MTSVCGFFNGGGLSDLPFLSTVVVSTSVKGSSAFSGGLPSEGDTSSSFLDCFCVQPGSSAAHPSGFANPGAAVIIVIAMANNAAATNKLKRLITLCILSLLHSPNSVYLNPRQVGCALRGLGALYICLAAKQASGPPFAYEIPL